MAALYFIFLTFITVVSLYTNFRLRNSNFKLLLSPSLALTVSFYLYSAALPLSRIFMGDGNVSYPPNPELDNLYMMHHLLAAVGLLAGFALARSANSSNSPAIAAQQESQYIIRNDIFFIFSISMVVVNIYITIQNIGGIGNILQPYGFNTAEDIFDVSSMEVGSIFEALWTYFALVPLVLFFSVQGKRVGRFVVLGIAMVLGLLFLVRGHRNLLGMLLLPLTTIYMLRKTLKVNRLILGAFGIFIFLYTVGIVRNFHLEEAGNVLNSVEVANFDPLSGEFATNYSVYTKYESSKFAEDYLYGKTYTIDPLVNIVPRAIWTSRPMTAAQSFSLSFYGALGGHNGLGFSPVVEAMLNYGVWGILPIFCLTALFICWFEKRLLRKGPSGIAIYAFLLPMAVNWNRIDIATTVKMFLIFASLALLFEKLFIIRRNDTPRSLT